MPSSTVTDAGPMTYWSIMAIRSIIVSNMITMFLPMALIILTELRTFGAFAKSDWLSSVVLHKHTFYFDIKECEFRYGYRKENLYLKLLKICRKTPLF